MVGHSLPLPGPFPRRRPSLPGTLSVNAETRLLPARAPGRAAWPGLALPI